MKPVRKILTILTLLCAVGSAYAADIILAQEYYDKGDFVKAFQEFSALAETGNPLAQSSLGVLYDNGQGVAKDDNKAIFWYRKSADQGNQFGEFNLGTMYFSGNGVEKDMVEACKWWSLSTRQGNGSARIHMRLCAKYLNDAQREEFNQRVEAHIAAHKQ
jgi:TPR repeat protein